MIVQRHNPAYRSAYLFVTAAATKEAAFRFAFLCVYAQELPETEFHEYIQSAHTEQEAFYGRYCRGGARDVCSPRNSFTAGQGRDTFRPLSGSDSAGAAEDRNPRADGQCAGARNCFADEPAGPERCVLCRNGGPSSRGCRRNAADYRQHRKRVYRRCPQRKYEEGFPAGAM